MVKIPHKLQLKTSTIVSPMLIVLVIWMVFWFEITFGYNFNNWGIQPRTLIGLRGIIFAPFIHGGVPHALSNTLPILMLGMALFYFYDGIAWKVILYGTLLTGLSTWLIARGHSTHIGASGMAYLMFSFLFFKGLFSKNFRLIALSLIVVFVYGSLVWGMFPGKPHISWEGHLSGFGSGLLFALIYRNYTVEDVYPTRKPDQPRRLSPREAEFLKHFDEDGNFVSSSELREREKTQDTSSNCLVEYIYMEEKGGKELQE